MPFHGLPRAVVADPVRHAPAVGVRVDAQGPAGRRVVVVRAEAGVLVLGDGLVGGVAAAVGLVEGVEGRRRRRRVGVPAHAVVDDGVDLPRGLDRLRDGGGVVAAAPRRVRRAGAGQAQQAVEPERRPDELRRRVAERAGPRAVQPVVGAPPREPEPRHEPEGRHISLSVRGGDPGPRRPRPRGVGRRRGRQDAERRRRVVDRRRRGLVPRRRAAPLRRRRGPLEQRAERRARVELAVAQLPLLLALLLRARAVDAGGRVPDELRRPGEARLDLAPQFLVDAERLRVAPRLDQAVRTFNFCVAVDVRAAQHAM